MHGLAHKRVFHIVAVNQRARRNAKPAEILGIYNPHIEFGDKHKTIEWSVDRIRYWLHVGAVPSKSVVKLLELVSFTLVLAWLSTKTKTSGKHP
jgi:small subunit ribosomal protein S16